MNILLLGSGGREHALAWKLAQSPTLKTLYAAPGNPGIAQHATLVDLDATDHRAVVDFCLRHSIGLVVIGPEAPLVDGLADNLRVKGFPVFGPGKKAAQLEGSKGFTKDLCKRAHIPTAAYERVTSKDGAIAALDDFGLPVVIKADGLAAGKGVIIAETREQALAALDDMFSGAFGAAGEEVVLEEFMVGEEASFFALTDGSAILPFGSAQDHKRVGDGDTGPNTGGMGAYSFSGLLDAQMTHWLLHHVAIPVVEGMKAEGAEYKGILYCGLMMTARGPMVLEFNCRFGDPETQPILMRLESDLVEAFEAAVEGRVSDGVFRWSNDASVCVVMASGGYPGTIEVGKKITGVEEANQIAGVKVFHAGTSSRDGEYYTSGGRVLGVTARAATLPAAVSRAYEAVGKIQFDGAHLRKDIAARALKTASGA